MANHPSPEAIQRMISFFKMTSLPRILEQEQKQKEEIKHDKSA